MKIDVIISADDIKRERILDKTVIVVDMLRATSVITTAIENGCKEIIPVLTIEEAVEIAKEDRKRYVLGGERGGLKLEGFDFGNSPLEYTKEKVKDKSVVMTTSNGTRAIKGSEGARNILIGSMLNGRAVAKKAIEMDNDVVFVNAGTGGELSIDDFLCSGYMIECIFIELEKGIEKDSIDLTDAAIIAKYAYGNNKLSIIKNARHYNRMVELEMKEDLEYCFQKDLIQVVPEYKDGWIRASL